MDAACMTFFGPHDFLSTYVAVLFNCLVFSSDPRFPDVGALRVPTSSPNRSHILPKSTPKAAPRCVLKNVANFYTVSPFFKKVDVLRT